MTTDLQRLAKKLAHKYLDWDNSTRLNSYKFMLITSDIGNTVLQWVIVAGHMIL